MNKEAIQRLLHLDCKNSSGGITDLAEALGKSPNLLSNKLNVFCEQNSLSFLEAIDLIGMAQSKTTVSAIAGLLDYRLVPNPKCVSSSSDMVQRFIDLSIQCGRFGQEMKQAMSADSELGEVLSRKEKKAMLDTVKKMTEVCLALELELQQ